MISMLWQKVHAIILDYIYIYIYIYMLQLICRISQSIDRLKYFSQSIDWLKFRPTDSTDWLK